MTNVREKAKMSGATTAPTCEAINLPIALLRDRAMTPELIGALLLGMVHDDEQPLPLLLQERGRMREARANRVTKQLLALRYVTREQERGPPRNSFGRMRYRYFTDPQLSR
jgi:hypothetical protein